ncbi:hypothetical protein ACFO26_02955 [Lactococcus nasutitermitis]|uniref:Uncharacterized protein n=1 Tax=Lactococcus nasutitermitis TaxID=1652957 RepID=A0ABV9JAX9_9LACT|nr:hypothetical protein [Lactococcus nasutitermitis]
MEKTIMTSSIKFTEIAMKEPKDKIALLANLENEIIAPSGVIATVRDRVNLISGILNNERYE